MRSESGFSLQRWRAGGRSMQTIRSVSAYAAAMVVAIAGVATAQQQVPTARPLRLYVFDCGLIKDNAVETYGFKQGEVMMKDFVVTCYLIVHPRGTLMWDVGNIRDSAFPADGGPAVRNRSSATKTLRSQMAQVGYRAADITYLAMSHLHSDHSANAADYVGSTWLVRQAELDAAFADPP